MQPTPQSEETSSSYYAMQSSNMSQSASVHDLVLPALCSAVKTAAIEGSWDLETACKEPLGEYMVCLTALDL